MPVLQAAFHRFHTALSRMMQIPAQRKNLELFRQLVAACMARL